MRSGLEEIDPGAGALTGCIFIILIPSYYDSYVYCMSWASAPMKRRQANIRDPITILPNQYFWGGSQKLDTGMPFP